MHYLREAITICPKSMEVLLLLSYIQWLETGAICDELFENLSQISDESSNTLSLVRIVQSKNYMCQDERLEMRYLEQAIHYSKEHPYSFYRLGCIFLRNGRVDQAKTHFLKAKEQVKNILTPDSFNDFTSYQAFIDEYLSWRSLSSVNYKELCDRCV